MFCESTRVYTQKLQGKSRVQNTRCTREMELTESRVKHEINTRVLASLSLCPARCQHGILFTGNISSCPVGPIETIDVYRPILCQQDGAMGMG